ncbi:hypothetical protein GCM10023334_087300 [Nonomuraea thailandensis]
MTNHPGDGGIENAPMTCATATPTRSHRPRGHGQSLPTGCFRLGSRGDEVTPPRIQTGAEIITGTCHPTLAPARPTTRPGHNRSSMT